MSTKESVIKSVPNVPAIKILPPQLARLKKEEEEETWISGEELYTEGSSDEESCRCKPVLSSKRTVESSSLSVAKVHRPKSKVDKKKKPSSLSSLAYDQNTLSAQSSSKGRSSPISSVSDEDEEYPADDEISWKANKETVKLQNEIVALEQHRREYPKICDMVDRVFETYFENIKNSEKVESENFIRKNEKLQEEIRESLSFVDAVINELDGKIENIKKRTKHIQKENRLRLKKIIEEGPPESNKLAQNTKKFFELCPNVQVKKESVKRICT